jgi:hypothetical protein
MTGTHRRAPFVAPLGSPNPQKMQPVARRWQTLVRQVTVTSIQSHYPTTKEASIMQKSAPYIILFVLALLLWNGLFDGAGVHIDLGDDDFDGPLGSLAALLLASGGVILGVLVAAIVVTVLALVFAGVGVLVVVAMVVAAVVTALAISPLLLPLLIPIAIIWLIARRKDQGRVSASIR